MFFVNSFFNYIILLRFTQKINGFTQKIKVCLQFPRSVPVHWNFTKKTDISDHSFSQIRVSLQIIYILFTFKLFVNICEQYVNCGFRGLIFLLVVDFALFLW